MELIGGVGMALALVYGSIQVSANQMTSGAFFSFMAALLLMYGPAKKLSRVNANLQQTIAASERIFEMLDTHTEVVEQPDAEAMAPFRRAIEFADVSFGYEDGHEDILRGVSFRVEAGQMIAIVGRSGAGKTTLVNMLPRFYDVTSGAILIDGVDIRHVTLASLRAQIGIVTQETVLFDDTIASNIAYGADGEGVARGDRGRGESGERARLRGRVARWLRHHDRRAGTAALRRPAAASGYCAGAAEERADSRARRGHVGARLRVGAAGAGGARQPDDEPDVVRHRAPALHDPPRRRDHRPGAGPDCRDRPARRAARAARRRVCGPVSDAAARAQ